MTALGLSYILVSRGEVWTRGIEIHVDSAFATEVEV